MKTTKLLYTLAVLFLLVSCSEKDSPRPEPEPIKKYLLYKKTSDISLADGTTKTINWDYIYDKDNKLSRIDALSKKGAEATNLGSIMEHDDRGRLTLVRDQTGRDVRLSYEGSSNLPSMVRVLVEGETPIVHLNKFNTLGRLTEQKIYAGEVLEENLQEILTLSYGKANQVSLRRTSASGQVYQEASITTDDRNRPTPVYPDHVSMNSISSEISIESLITEHNVTAYEIITFYSGAVDNSFTSTYTYNQDGYPTASTRTYKSGDVERITYDYLVK
ncbi:hypothetical protein I0P70_11045 [Pontibacter sp. FD36]|uniref:hypothetical protein n=1 Tax=Pontibacter sp. FD36 TaxID=2789860 RepID=UPI0018AB563C|nr:hypothetical protein [Pontibacter sp. FD36]MBF8963787.1 hypothetical protein [Pontibacter sp. FD36]